MAGPVAELKHRAQFLFSARLRPRCFDFQAGQDKFAIKGAFETVVSSNAFLCAEGRTTFFGRRHMTIHANFLTPFFAIQAPLKEGIGNWPLKIADESKIKLMAFRAKFWFTKSRTFSSGVGCGRGLNGTDHGAVFLVASHAHNAFFIEFTYKPWVFDFDRLKTRRHRFKSVN